MNCVYNFADLKNYLKKNFHYFIVLGKYFKPKAVGKSIHWRSVLRVYKFVLSAGQISPHKFEMHCVAVYYGVVLDNGNKYVISLEWQ